jgi:hypothetical protein
MMLMTWDWEKLKQQQQGKLKVNLKPEKSKKKKIPEWAFLTTYIIVAIMLAVLMWFPVRWLHYKFAYEDKVRQEIIEMVKPEALKDKYKGI